MKTWQADWDRFEEIAEQWDKLLSEVGGYAMAERISKTKSYRAYDQKWPFDNMIRWQDNSPIEDLKKESNSASVEEEVADRLDTQTLINNLTPKQKLIFEALRDGKDSVEIEIEQGYNTNNAVRWHKHQIKKKYTAIKDDKYEQKFEFVCRECGNIFNGEKIKSTCPSCDSQDTLFLKSYFKPIFED